MNKNQKEFYTVMAWIVIAVIFIVGMLVGMLYTETNVNKPKIMKSNYDYCVKGCKFLLNVESKYCEIQCDILVREVG